MKFSKNQLYILLSFLLLIVSIYALMSSSLIKRSSLPLNVYSVETNSMAPSIRKGSIVFVRKNRYYEKGDIINYKFSQAPEKTITHRVINIEEYSDQKIFITKGDANNVEDSSRITQDLIVGKVVFIIPFIGYLTSFSRTLLGILSLVIIPSVLIISSQMVTIRDELKNINKNKKNVLKINLFQLAYFFFLPLLIIIRPTNAYLSDSTSASLGLLSENWSIEVPSLSLYFNNEKNSLGFKLTEISDYEDFSYELTYEHDSITELVSGNINTNFSHSFTSEWIVLGTCSSGGICVYHNDISDINLKVILTNTSGFKILEKAI